MKVASKNSDIGSKIAGAKVPVKKMNKKPEENFSEYLYDVLKSIHPELGINKRAMSVMNAYMWDVFQRLATEGGHLSSSKRVMNSRELHSAVRLVFPGKLAEHAMKDGINALKNYEESKVEGKKV